VVDYNKKSLSRELALKYLYHFFLKENNNLQESLSDGSFDQTAWKSDLQEFYQSLEDPDPDLEQPGSFLEPQVKGFAEALLIGVFSKFNEIKQLLSSSIKGKNWNSIDHVGQALLMLGCYELKHEETPHQVVLNESINLAKKYGHQELAALINGVLDGIRKK
jgi:transcription antitermination protein NusB